MTVTVKDKTPITVPDRVRRRAGFKPGDQVEFKVSGGVVTIVPKLPLSDDEYTPEQRRIIDARLRESEEDFKAGRSYGPFHTADEMIAHMKAKLKQKATSKKAKSPR